MKLKGYKYQNIMYMRTKRARDILKSVSSADMEVETSSKNSFGFSLFGLESFVDKYKTMTRPPPEPPPWSCSINPPKMLVEGWRPLVRGIFRVCWLRHECFLLCFVCYFNNCCFCYGFCFFVYFPVCKTLYLDIGDESNIVTVFGFLFPSY
ncbi:unnamed protein product, partial [Cuscuta epithymum]